MIKAVISRYQTKDAPYMTWCYQPDDYEAIYERMMKLTGNDHEISSDAASWCELATETEAYTFREGEIVIEDID